jgi:hypothetical protein
VSKLCGGGLIGHGFQVSVSRERYREDIPEKGTCQKYVDYSLTKE